MVKRIPPFLLSTLKIEDRRDLVPIGDDLTGSGSLNSVCRLEFVGFWNVVPVGITDFL